MRRILGQLFLIGMFALSCRAFDSDNAERTAGVFNGRFWNGMNASQRLGYIQGWCERDENNLCPTELTFGDICDSVTEFYKEPENRIIAIGWVMQFIKKKVEGASPAELEKLKAGLRWDAIQLEKRNSK